MENNKTNYINFESASINITKECCNYLLDNNYHQNDELTNLNLLEHSLVNYTIIKLLNWNIDIEELNLDNYDNLDSLLSIINKLIPNEKDKEAFFSQYIHCIIYIYGDIIKETINWTKDENTENKVVFKCKNNKLQEITTSKNIETYKLITALINNLKTNYLKEENPILKK